MTSPDPTRLLGDAVLPAVMEIDLTSPNGAALLAVTAGTHGALLAPAAHRHSRMVLLRSPWAPGLRFAGGQAVHDGGPDALCDRRVFSQSGPSETLEGALASCIGEAVELLSQIEQSEDVQLIAPLEEVADHVTAAVQEAVRVQLVSGPGGARALLGWMRGHLPAGGRTVLVPADWCVRRSASRMAMTPPWHLGTGVAAGPDWDWAASRALLELIERDAVAQWWVGGRRGRPLALEDPALAAAARLSADLRQGLTARSTWLLDVTTDLGVPCLVAISTNPDGRGTAFGFGARLSRTEAARRAILENAQMELALLMARARSQGAVPACEDAAAAEVDERLLSQAAQLDAATCDLLHPRGAPRERRAGSAEHADSDRALPGLVATLETFGIETILVDLTRPEFAIPVVRAIAPGLQPMPSQIVTPRLQQILQESGGGTWFTKGQLLF